MKKPVKKSKKLAKGSHLYSLLISSISVGCTLIGYFLIELQNVDFGSVDPLVIKGLLISIGVRSIIKLIVENMDYIQTNVTKMVAFVSKS